MTTAYLAMERGLLVARERDGRWTVERHLAGLQTTCLASDPGRPERIYCGTYGRGLWRSDDAGRSWVPIGDAGEAMEPWDGTGIAHPRVMAIAVSATERGEGYGVVSAGTEPGALFRSENGGDTWRELTGLHELPSAPTWRFPPRPHTNLVRWIAPDPLVPGRLFVAMEAGALVQSADGGHTWRDRQPGGPFDSHTIGMHPQTPDRLFIAGGDGYCESPDGGATWQWPDEGLSYRYLWSLALDPADPDTVLVTGAPDASHAHHLRGAARSTLFRRVGGAPWEKVERGLPDEEGTVIPVVASHATEPGTFYALSNKGLFRSRDAGASWEDLDLPWAAAFADQHQQALIIAPD